MTESEGGPASLLVSLPVPTAEEILEDLRNAPESDVVFSAPPAEPANGTEPYMGRRGGGDVYKLCTQTEAVYIIQLLLLFFLVKGFASSRSEEASRVVEDSVRFIRSYQRLEGGHRNVLPKIVSDLKQCIHELTSEISTSSAR